MNIQKFEFVEMFNNSKGKTSPMLTLAFFGGVVSLLVFFFCAGATFFMQVFESKTDVTNLLTNITMQSVGLFTVCMGALTTRRFTKDKDIENGQQNA